jgi:two-component system phosphate regulon sensor histidine kinase PhoR
VGFFVILFACAAAFAAGWVLRHHFWRKQISELFHRIGAKNLEDVARALVQKAESEARLERDLQEIRRLLHMAIHEAPIGAILIDAEGKIQMMNDCAIRLLGARVAPVGRYQWEVIRSAPLASLIENIRRSDRPIQQTFTASDGVQSDYVRATIVPAGQPPFGTLVFLENVKPEEEWRRRKEDMIQTLSHELKTPVSVISGYMELLFDALPEEEIRREVLLPLRQAVETLKNLISDVMTLYRLESSPPTAFERVSFGALAESVNQVLAPIARQRNVSLHWDIARPDPILFGNSTDLNQMLLNLVQNGIIYNRPGGSVFVSTRKEGSYLVIEVRDTGIGISSQDIPRIFERFYRAEKGRSRENGGTGLGLAIVKHIAERHNGKVTVESRVGEGSVFRVYLPLTILEREPETAGPLASEGRAEPTEPNAGSPQT